MFGRGARASQGRFGNGPYVVGGLLLALVAVLGIGAIVVSSSSPSLTVDSTAIAKVTMPLGGGSIESVTVIGGRSDQPVPVVVHNGLITPKRLLPADERLLVQVVVKRPGWIAWLAGKTQRLTLTVTTPAAGLRSHYVTVRGTHTPVVLHFRAPITTYSYGPSPRQLRRHLLSTPSATVALPRTGIAGSVFVSAAPQAWEFGRAAAVSWFPSGGAATAVAFPAPGSTIRSTSTITLTFSKPIAKVLGSHMPLLSPATPGSWHAVNDHMIQFHPEGYGYGLGATVKLALPSGVRVVGGAHTAAGTDASWIVPPGSTTRLQQLLATLGYLPLRFNYAGAHVALTPAAQEAAAIKPPAGSFSMRWSSIPGWYKSEWSPGSYGELTKAAVMAFENTEGMTADGVDGPLVWNALMNAVIKHQNNSFGYTVVTVSEASPETESTWHNGKGVESGLVYTGIPATPTALGTFAVFEHALSVTMSGTNADGSHYSDPGVPWVSYFNGGDALHGFIRAGYGYPQSDGCVEMPYSEAEAVYPYTPIGTVVHVE
ncbi:MAG: L,D-transpeptidase family protein [Solirubrobacteraceae bacterium]